MNFFSLVHEYLLGLLDVHSFNFPLREYFFVLRPPTPPPPRPHDPFLLLHYLYLDQQKIGGRGEWWKVWPGFRIVTSLFWSPSIPVWCFPNCLFDFTQPDFKKLSVNVILEILGFFLEWICTNAHGGRSWSCWSYKTVGRIWSIAAGGISGELNCDKRRIETHQWHNESS